MIKRIIFWSLLIVAPTFSLELLPQLDKSHQKILIYNAKIEQIRQILLISYDPKADNRFHRYGRVPIILLLGASSAGKTTIINPIKSKRPEIKDYGIDTVYYDLYGHIIKWFFPCEYEALRKKGNYSLP